MLGVLALSMLAWAALKFPLDAIGIGVSALGGNALYGVIIAIDAIGRRKAA